MFQDLSVFIDERLPLEEFIRTEYIGYTKINYVKADFSSFNDLSSEQLYRDYMINLVKCQGLFREDLNLDKNIESYYRNQTIVGFFAEICDQNPKKISFYSKSEDTTLGQLIQQKVEGVHFRCENKKGGDTVKLCNKHKYEHVSVYYHLKNYLRISVEYEKGHQDKVTRHAKTKPAERGNCSIADLSNF